MKIFKYFDSLGQFSRYLAEGTVQPKYTSSQVSMTAGADWTGTDSWEQAENLLQYGDKEAADKILSEGFEAVRSHGQMARRQVYTSPVGFAPHVPNYIAGRPNNMINCRQVRQPSPVINVVYNISNNGGVSSEAMRRAAISLLAALYNIECSGTRVNLFLCDISKWPSRGEYLGWTIKIKSASQPFDILKMAYPMTNTSMLRRHSFRFTEVTPHECGDYGSAVHDANCLKNTIPALRGDIKAVHFTDINGLSVAEVQKMICER